MSESEEREVPAIPFPELARAFSVSFLMLGSYYLIRPVRDDIGSEYNADLETLFLFTFASMVVLSPIHGFFVARVLRKRLVPVLYLICAGVLLAFRGAYAAGPPAPVVEKGLYVFLAVYNLFVVSSFWSWMSDRFDEENARRWFGPIAVGGTIAAMLGSSTTAFLGDLVGTTNLLLVSAGVLALAGVLIFFDSVPPRNAHRARIGGNPFQGAVAACTNPYLAGIAAYIFFMTIGGTLLYLEQSHIFAEHFGEDRAARKALLAKMDLATNAGTLLFQLGVIGPWMLSKRITPVLAALPVIGLVGFPILGYSPSLMVVVVLMVATRVGKYGLAKPSREALYTVVPGEDRYKAKAFADTVIYRGGDWFTTWLSNLIRGSGSYTILAYAFTPVALVWLVLSVWLGRRQAQLADDQ